MVRTKDSAARDTRGSDPAEARARRLERVVGTIRAVLWMLDERGNTLAVTDPVGALLGLPPAEIIAGGSQRFWSRIHDAERDMVADAFAAMFEGTRAFDVEFRMQHRDGAWVWLHARAVAARAHGETLYAELVVSDATAQKQAERKEHADRQRLRIFVGGSPVVSCLRRPSGSFAPAFVTENVAAILGHSTRQIVESPSFWTRLVHPDDRARVQSSVRAALDEGRAACEYRVLHLRGDYRWIRDEIRVVRSADGQGTDLVSFWCDLGDRKRLEQACQRLEATVALLAGRSADAILLASNGCVTFANDAFASSCGVDQAEDLTGMELLGMVDPRDRSALAALLGEGEDRVAPVAPLSLRWNKKRGGTVTLRCGALPSSVAGEPALLLFGAPA